MLIRCLNTDKQIRLNNDVLGIRETSTEVDVMVNHKYPQFDWINAQSVIEENCFFLYRFSKDDFDVTY